MGRLRTVWDALAGGEERPRSDEQHLAGALRWLCRSQDVTGNGGSASCYNLVLGWGDAYPETTGYIVPTLLRYGNQREEPSLVNRAIQMADWLLEIQRSDGAFPEGTGESGEPSVFNTGQIIFGLVAAYRETGDDRYRRSAIRACDWLVEQQSPEGYWERHTYKNNVHTYSTRVAWALLEGEQIAQDGRTRYREAAESNFRWAMGRQRANGWFDGAGFGDGSRAFLHTIAYTIRGLLEGGIGLRDRDIVNAARRSADRLLAMQQRDGILRGSFDDSWDDTWYYCLTGNAQMALVWSILHRQTGHDEYRAAARDSVQFLKRKQVLGGPAAIDGALPGSSPVYGRYMFLRYPNWGVKFFSDAVMSLSEEYEVRNVARART
jgi:hypothetical protein